jgi:hypothetical protein
MVLVNPTTVVQWRRSRRLGRPSISQEMRDLIRQMSLAKPLCGATRINEAGA